MQMPGANQGSNSGVGETKQSLDIFRVERMHLIAGLICETRSGRPALVPCAP
jgi:hypothetical protein